ncbi:MAG TPA: ATP-binding protein [Spirochaetota bacterium]|nr:ATP-binding protein [Spirochaetota bacterium]HPJ34928.1 ATP-binding protein [Spirochaetota bacterium]
MKELVIISGKGGTGKTSISGSFAALSENKVMADCDVDAADLHIILDHTVLSDESFSTSRKAVLTPELCIECGKCLELCRFDAITENFRIKQLSCEGCGVCAAFCPAGAIKMVDHESGRWFVSDTPKGPLVHACLGMAEGNSGKLVALLRKKAREIAEEKGYELIIVDGSPGTGCPVIASVTGASYLLIVTEPTVSGLHDLKRALELAAHFRVKSGVCVNRADINSEMASEIEKYCKETGISFLGTIPYDKDVTSAQIEGKPVVDHSDGAASQSIKVLWNKVLNEISE